MRRALAFVLLAGLAAGCGPGDSKASSSPATDPKTVLAAFRSAGLEVGTTLDMEHRDYGLAPLVAERGVRFLIPSIGVGNGGRVMSFANAADLRESERYYVNLGRQSALLSSWTFANPQRLVLVQINGDLPAAKAKRYERVVDSL